MRTAICGRIAIGLEFDDVFASYRATYSDRCLFLISLN